MDHDNWYADTAYDSRKKKDVPPPDPTAWQGKERALRAHPLPIGVYCGDYRADLSKATVRELQKGLPSGRLTHECGEMYTMNNPKMIIATFRWLGGVFSFIGLLTIITTFNSREESLLDWQCNIYFTIPFFIFVICHLLMKVVPDKNNTVFNRRTGMVTIPRPGEDSPNVLPFAEFDGYYFCSQSTVNVNYHLYLGHRFSPIGYTTGKDWVRRYRVHVEWEFLQHYMDISMPLPDIPELEPYRHLDPTTAEYGKQHNRPPHYWRDISMLQLEEKRKEGIDAIQNYPWDRLRADHIPEEIMKKLFPGARLFS